MAPLISYLRCCAERLDSEPGDAGDAVRDTSKLLPGNCVRGQPLVNPGLEDVREFVDSVTTEFDVAA
jgi:hypothetical protein